MKREREKAVKICRCSGKAAALPAGIDRVETILLVANLISY